MPKLDMDGPHPFAEAEIDSGVEARRIGNYALGHVNDEETFIVKYVGRSDTDLKRELKARLSPKYTHFKFSYATSIREAFEKECKNYHDFNTKGLLDNENHPDRPNGEEWKCPSCDALN
jgi:hypothetical protein